MVSVLKQGAGQLQQLLLGPIGPHQRVTFGRSPDCDVVLEHLSISRQHATLTVDGGGGVLLTDLGSAHGTKLGDTWIKQKEPRGVKVGAEMRFGGSTRSYRLEGGTRVG